MQLPVKSQTSKYVGTRSNLVYFPPGYSENPRCDTHPKKYQTHFS